MRETVCVIYDCVGEMIFYWNHYRYRFLESVKVSKRIILQMEKEFPANVLNVKVYIYSLCNVNIIII